jgi:hypothetical protein
MIYGFIFGAAAVAARQYIKSTDTNRNEFDLGEIVLGGLWGAALGPFVAAWPLRMLIPLTGLGLANAYHEYQQGHTRTMVFDLILTLIGVFGAKAAHNSPLSAKMQYYFFRSYVNLQAGFRGRDPRLALAMATLDDRVIGYGEFYGSGLRKLKVNHYRKLFPALIEAYREGGEVWQMRILEKLLIIKERELPFFGRKIVDINMEETYPILDDVFLADGTINQEIVIRRMDLEVTLDGPAPVSGATSHKMQIEAKVGGSQYLPRQQYRDGLILNQYGIPTVVARAPWRKAIPRMDPYFREALRLARPELFS